MLLTTLKKMTQNITSKLVNNAEIAEKKIIELKRKLDFIRDQKVRERINQLTEENKILTGNIEKVKSELIQLEIKNGKKQYVIPGKNLTIISNDISGAAKLIQENNEKKVTKEKKVKEQPKKTKEKSTEISDNIDVRKLDFKIGKIIDINKHPDADSLYVEIIECGEENPRTVVSGLVNHVPIDEMRNRIVMILCNLKPVKMRGVTSEAMVMCASSPEKVEVLIPPADAVPGDLVSCDGYPREPEPQLNPKKKIFETCAPDLKTNSEKVACYKGTPLVVAGKGPIVASTLKDVFVK